MSGNDEQQEELNELGDFIDEVNSYITEISQHLPRLHNIEYNSQSNTTSIYGHTNFEELKVNGSNVALASHVHKTDDITRDITTTIVNEGEEEEEVTETQTLNDILDGKAEVAHNHSISDVTGLQTALDGKADANHSHDSTYAGISHEHTMSEITNLQSTLEAMGSDISGKAAYIHEHTMSEITNLSESFQALSNDISDKANAVHTHLISEINGLGDALDGKASTSHNHDSTYAPLIHTHAIDEVVFTYEEEEETVNEEEQAVTTTVTKTKTLSEVLAGKSDVGHTHSTFNYGNSTATFDENGDFKVFANSGWSGNPETLRISHDGGFVICPKHYSGGYARYISVGWGSGHMIRMWYNYRSREMFAMDYGGCAKFNGEGSNPVWIASMSGNYRLAIGSALSNNNTAIIQYKEATTPHTLNFGFYDNEDLLTLDTTGNVNVTGNITAPNITTITNTLANKANATHTHNTTNIYREITTVNGNNEQSTATIALNDILDDKSDVGHSHAISDVTGLQTALDGKAASNHTHDYSSTYAAINHNHDSLYAAINHTHDYSSTFAAINHTHDYSSTFAPLLHTHAISDVTGLQTALDGKAASTHTHDFSSTFAAINHNHDGTYAKLSADNSFTGNITVSGDVTYGGRLYNTSTTPEGARFLNSSTASNTSKYIMIGHDGNAGNNAYLRYLYYADNHLYNRFEIGFWTYGELYSFYRDKVNFSKPLNVTGAVTATSTVTGTNVLANNETRLAACETAIANVSTPNYSITPPAMTLNADITISSTSRIWKSICYGNGKFVAHVKGTSDIAYSTDGITWNETTISSTVTSFGSICYGAGKFVAVDGGYTCV